MKNKRSIGILSLISAFLIGAAALAPAAVSAARTGDTTDRLITSVSPVTTSVPGVVSDSVQNPLPDWTEISSDPVADVVSVPVSEPSSEPIPDPAEAPVSAPASDPEDLPAASAASADTVDAVDAADTDPTKIADSEDEEVFWCAEEMELYASVAPDVGEVLEKYVDLDVLHEYLREQFMQFNTTIDIRDFGIKRADVKALLNYIWDAMPECFHVNSSISYSWGSSDIIVSITVGYTYTEAEYREELAKCEYAAQRILSGIVGNDSLSDAEKSLLIHDRLAIWCQYDMRLYSTGVPKKSYRMNGALADGVAVCQGYALAYGYLLDQVGIDNYLVSSDTLNHAWNIVYIDGKSYHVDVTWDDPINDVAGRVLHKNFLRSTAGITETKHTATDYDMTPTDTTYDNAYWQASETEFQYLEGKLYYIDSNAEILYRRENGQSVQLISVKNYWMVAGGSGSYYLRQPKLSSDGLNLLYSQPDGVYAYNLATGSITAVWKPDLSVGAYFSVYGFTYRCGELICQLYNTPSFPRDEGVVTVRQKYAVLAGDADGDGMVSVADLILMQRWLNGLDVEIEQSLCDVDGDGEISMRDIVLLQQYLNGFNVSLK